MSDKLQRLELVWPGKNERVDVEPRILIEDVEKSQALLAFINATLAALPMPAPKRGRA